jgi:hypothetical protein
VPRFTSGLGCDDDVAGHGQLASSAQSKAADSGNHGLGDTVDAVAIGKPALKPLIKWHRLGHLLDIRPGRENSFSAGYNHGADLGILIERLQRSRQLLHERRRQGV